jgi:hypothetical protein
MRLGAEGGVMFEDVTKAAEALANAKAAWVDRRDAAEYLGDTGGRALGALQAHRKDADVDVRSAVEKALGRLATDLGGVKPVPPGGAYPLEGLARACEKPGQRAVKPHEQGYAIDVLLKAGRHQRVYLAPSTRKDGTKLIRVFTYCGKPTPESLRWALRINAQLTHGALALAGDGDDATFVLVRSYLADEATPGGIKASVKEIAAYGDWIEGKLTGLDDL